MAIEEITNRVTYVDKSDKNKLKALFRMKYGRIICGMFTKNIEINIKNPNLKMSIARDFWLLRYTFIKEKPVTKKFTNGTNLMIF